MNHPMKQKDIDKYITKDGKIIAYPSKRHRAVRPYIYAAIAGHFEANQQYSEKEVNAIIQAIILFEDYVLIRRELIDFGYLGRTNDGRAYWLVNRESLDS